MKKAIAALAVVGCLIGIFSCDTSEGPGLTPSVPSVKTLPKELVPPTTKEDSTKNATAAIDGWLKLVDDGQYDSAWDQTGGWLKQTAPKGVWTKQVKAIREAFGPLVSRTVKTTDYKTQIPRMPPGVYVNITWDSSFGNVKNAYEEIGATYDDGKWQPLGYYVGAKPIPTNSPGQPQATGTAVPK